MGHEVWLLRCFKWRPIHGGLLLGTYNIFDSGLWRHFCVDTLGDYVVMYLDEYLLDFHQFHNFQFKFDDAKFELKGSSPVRKTAYN
jgi:hypothetical protein